MEMLLSQTFRLLRRPYLPPLPVTWVRPSKRRFRSGGPVMEVLFIVCEATSLSGFIFFWTRARSWPASPPTGRPLPVPTARPPDATCSAPCAVDPAGIFVGCLASRWEPPVLAGAPARCRSKPIHRVFLGRSQPPHACEPRVVNCMYVGVTRQHRLLRAGTLRAVRTWTPA